MNDPYSVPDNYHDNPLADLASEKMKEINEAYDTITKSREQGGASSYSYGGSAYQSAGQSRGASGSAQYVRIRNLINANDLAQAEAMLNAISNHDAEWYYLMGSVYWRRGWMDQAGQYYRTAATMDPGNPEYRNAVQYMNQGGQAYRPAGGMGMDMMGGDAACNMCQNLICADCCCEAMGGNLIPCIGCR